VFEIMAPFHSDSTWRQAEIGGSCYSSYNHKW